MAMLRVISITARIPTLFARFLADIETIGGQKHAECSSEV